jgi:hypothetical protein
MTLLEFMGAHPALTVILAFIFMWTIIAIIRALKA